MNLTKELFLSFVGFIAARNGCKITDIKLDPEGQNHSVDISCPEENEAKCARELEEFFGNYSITNQIETDKDSKITRLSADMGWVE